MHYSLYDGSWEALPDINKLNPIKSIQIDKDFNFNGEPSKSDQVHRIEGQVEIPVDGYYIFLLESVDDAILVVDDQVIIKGTEKTVNGRQSYVLPLAKGIHSLQLSFLQKRNSPKINFIIYQDKLKEKDDWWDNEFLSF